MTHTRVAEIYMIAHHLSLMKLHNSQEMQEL